MNKYNLDIPIYLNQKVVFDLLASINNGLAQVTKLKTTSNVDGEIVGGLESDLGNKNIFTLLGVSLKGKVSGERNQEQEQEKVHTPSSLFNNLKAQLFKEKMVKRIYTQKEFEELNPGEFVEVTGLLKLNPLVNLMSNMTNMMELATIMQNDVTGKKKSNVENKHIIGQMHAFTNSLKANGMVDMICASKGKFYFSSVLPVYMSYFFNENINEIVDGEFKVLGKVTKVCNNGEKIDLLRNTSFTLFRESMLNSLISSFDTDNNADIETGQVQKSVDGPALLIIPIAIYI